MAHGAPRLEICNNCNHYGLTPRFSESKCPKCGKPTEQIDRDEMKRKLGIGCWQDFNPSFTWRAVANEA